MITRLINALIWGGLALDPLDHENFKWSFMRNDAQAELCPDGVENAVASDQRIAIAGLAEIQSPREAHVILLRQAGVVDDWPIRCSGEEIGQALGGNRSSREASAI